jgi:hypothetical protein
MDNNRSNRSHSHRIQGLQNIQAQERTRDTQ